MTPKRSIALVLSIIIVFSLIAFIQLEKNNFSSFNLTTPITSVTSPNQPVLISDLAKVAQPSIVSNSTRAEIYDFIVANPGIQFRGICTGLGIAIGTAEFHLGVLKKAGLISFVRDGKFKRFFATKKFSSFERKIISLLRHKTTREILKRIITEKTVSHSNLASSLSISSQGLTWQMNRLREQGIIQENFTSTRVTYSLNEVYLQTLPALLYATEC